jgi:hypothetical protein
MKYAVLVNDRLVATCDDLEQAKRAAAACLLRRPAAHPIQKYEEAASETPAVRIERANATDVATFALVSVL